MRGAGCEVFGGGGEGQGVRLGGEVTGCLMFGRWWMKVTGCLMFAKLPKCLEQLNLALLNVLQ